MSPRTMSSSGETDRFRCSWSRERQAVGGRRTPEDRVRGIPEGPGGRETIRTRRRASRGPADAIDDQAQTGCRRATGAVSAGDRGVGPPGAPHIPRQASQISLKFNSRTGSRSWTSCTRAHSGVASIVGRRTDDVAAFVPLDGLHFACQRPALGCSIVRVASL